MKRIVETIASPPGVTQGELEKHLRSRGVDALKTKVVIDEESGIATFLLYNLSGQLIGYQRYNPTGTKQHQGRRNKGAKRHDPNIVSQMKYYTYVGKEGDKRFPKLAVWGLESLDDRPYVFVVEGIFDAVKLQNAGQPAIAALANHPKPLKGWFRMLGKHVIVVNDNDAAGGKLTSLGDSSFVVPDEWKDLGDMPQHEVNEFVADVLEALLAR